MKQSSRREHRSLDLQNRGCLINMPSKVVSRPRLTAQWLHSQQDILEQVIRTEVHYDDLSSMWYRYWMVSQGRSYIFHNRCSWRMSLHLSGDERSNQLCCNLPSLLGLWHCQHKWLGWSIYFGVPTEALYWFEKELASGCITLPCPG